MWCAGMYALSGLRYITGRGSRLIWRFAQDRRRNGGIRFFAANLRDIFSLCLKYRLFGNGSILGKPKNKSAKMWRIFRRQKHTIFHHKPPSSNHEFTTKTPHKNTSFSRTPSKNARKTVKNRPRGRLKFFLHKSSEITADSNNPAHSTGRRNTAKGVAADIHTDSAAATAAVAAAHQLQAD
jgi:hypothetical protein